MPHPYRALACLLALISLTLHPAAAGSDQAGKTVTVFAAASLKTAMDAIVPGFEAETGHRVTMVLAGSSVLARQIQAGAPADIFISANQAWMDALQRDGLIDPATRFALAGNRLVLIAHGNAAPLDLTVADGIAARLGDGRLAIALTGAVPAGIYAEAALRALEHWDGVARLLAQTDNVRAALALVALGEAPMGIVYATDAAAEARVSVVATFPADSHAPIVYPVARVGTEESVAADHFLRWLKGPQTSAALDRLGFSVPPGPGG